MILHSKNKLTKELKYLHKKNKQNAKILKNETAKWTKAGTLFNVCWLEESSIINKSIEICTSMSLYINNHILHKIRKRHLKYIQDESKVKVNIQEHFEQKE